MKKKILALALAISFIFSEGTVFAEDLVTEESETIDLYDQYSTYYADDTSPPLLTFEEALEKALRNDTSLRTASASLELAEDKLEISSLTSYTSTSSLLSFVSQQTSIANSKISQAAQEDSVQQTLKEAYIAIIESQRNIALMEKQLSNTYRSYQEAKINYNMGTISKNELDTQQLAYETAQKNLEQSKDTLELDYISLNIIMGVDVDNRYSFEMPVEYEVMEEPANLDNYIDNMVNKNPSVLQQENNYDLAIKEFNLSTIYSSEIGAMASGENSINSAEMSLNDTKDNLYEQYLNLYDSIRKYESTYEAAVKELTVLKSKCEAARLNYESGKGSLKDYETAKTDVEQQENTIISTLYDHALAVEKFENPNLM